MRGLGLLVTGLLGTVLMGATEARAVFTVNVEEVGTNVVATGSGTLDISGLDPASPPLTSRRLHPIWA